MVVKVRLGNVVTHTGGNRSGGTPLSGNNVPYKYAKYLQSVDTRGHPYRLLGKVGRNIGGHFISKRYDVELGQEKQWSARLYNGAGEELYYVKTTVVPSTGLANRIRDMAALTSSPSMLGTLDSIVPSPMSNGQLAGLGSKAVSMYQPLNPVADTSTTIAEFVSERKFFNIPGNAGSLPGEYLNYMFGIAPTVGYAQDLRSAIGNKEKILDQLHRDSGKWVRRRGPVYDNTDTTTTISTTQRAPGTVGPGLNTYLARGGRLQTTTSLKTTVWFSGAFTYHLPKEDTTMRTIAELDKLYGVKLNVDTAWELLPFSWLVDYKTNVGAVLSNLSAFSSDGLVMPYGYVMCTTRRTNEYLWSGELRDENGAWRFTSLFARDHQVTKQRLPANPFGFGINPGDLSGRQLSILAALGISSLT